MSATTETTPGTPAAPDAFRPQPRLYVGSEVGALRRVIVHRPDLELRLTPSNKDELLFDDVLWVRRARQEHDAFADALVERGVEVLYLHELLGQTLELSDAHEAVLEQTLAAAALGPNLGPEVREWLGSLAGEELAQWLIGGIAYGELPFRTNALAAQVATLDGFVLAPLPNHLLTRDTSAWVYNGVSVHAMAKPARRREAIHLEAIYRHHPLFADVPHALWSNGFGGPVSLEGGDILVIGNGCVDRHGRADTPRRCRAVRHPVVRRRRRTARDRGRAPAPALEHAPRHGDDNGRSRRVHDLPGAARHPRRIHAHARSIRAPERRARGGSVRGDRPRPGRTGAAAVRDRRRPL